MIIKILVELFAVIGALASLIAFFNLAGWADGQYHVWQLRRQRVHDDLNAHEVRLDKMESILEGQQSLLDSISEEICDLEKKLGKLSGKRAFNFAAPATPENPVNPVNPPA